MTASSAERDGPWKKSSASSFYTGRLLVSPTGRRLNSWGVFLDTLFQNLNLNTKP